MPPSVGPCVPEAADAFRRGTEVSPDDAGAWRDLGCLVALKNYREALVAWQKTAELNPEMDVAKAIAELEAATDDSEQIRGLAMWAYWCLERGDFRPAEHYFDSALELDPRRDVDLGEKRHHFSRCWPEPMGATRESGYRHWRGRGSDSITEEAPNRPRVRSGCAR